MPSIETLTAYSVTIAGIVAIILQLVKDGIINPRMPDTPARTALLRGLSYLLNLALLLGALALAHQFDPAQTLAYVALAFGQSVGSHAAYSTLSTGSGTPKTAEALADSVTEPPLGG